MSDPSAHAQNDKPPKPSVAELLMQARAQETQRKRCANRTVNDQFAPDYAAGVVCAKVALKLREQAEDEDPHRKDPAWQLDTAPNDKICAFLRTWIDLP